MLEMREIEAFLTVAEELHFGRAADRLRLSTSRVSNLIRTVERRAGTPLFSRTSRVVRLTPQGAQLFGELRAAHIRIAEALRDVRWSADLRGEVLRVGFATTLPPELSALTVAAYEQRYLDCAVVVSGLPAADLFNWPGQGWPVDVFVNWMPVDSIPAQPRWHLGPVLYRAPRVVVLPTGHPLAGQDSVNIEELAAFEVIHPQLPDWYGELLVPSLTPSGRAIRRRRVPARYVEDLLRLVSHTGLAHLTFDSLPSAYERPGVRLLPMTGLPPVPVRAMWTDGPNNQCAQRFAETAAPPLRRAA
jgi:DNA-binding transcriptional LysR family regulator